MRVVVLVLVAMFLIRAEARAQFSCQQIKLLSEQYSERQLRSMANSMGVSYTESDVSAIKRKCLRRKSPSRSSVKR